MRILYVSLRFLWVFLRMIPCRIEKLRVQNGFIVLVLGDVGPNSPLFEQGQDRAAVTSDGHRRVERNSRGSYTR